MIKKLEITDRGVGCLGSPAPWPAPRDTGPDVLSPPTGSLSALVYQHSIIPLALPCKLVIPNRGRNVRLLALQVHF